jgi:hypothetical protein
MKVEKFEVNWKDILLHVDGHFYRYYPATWEQPAEGDYFDLEVVYLQNVDVSRLLNEDDWYELEQVVYSRILREREREREEAREARQDG